MNSSVNWVALWWMVTGFGAFPVISGKARERVSALVLGQAEAPAALSFPHTWSPELEALEGRGREPRGKRSDLESGEGRGVLST